MRRNTIDIITLGCSKNLVDSEKLMRQLEANGYKVTHDSPNPQGEIAVINVFTLRWQIVSSPELTVSLMSKLSTMTLTE